jgi:acetyl-CoA carboxylase carboxyl transferase subunit alpha
VISPEGCASILWKDPAKASEAARAMGITASQILNNKLVDRVVSEPLGGAHRNLDEMAITLKTVLTEELAQLKSLSIEELLAKRYNKFMAMGAL